MSQGINSYEEFAKKNNVTRSTVYRRLANLEKTGVIVRRLQVGVDFEKLNLVAVHVGINVSHLYGDRTIEALKKYSEIKIILRTYGTSNLIVVVFCSKGEEGKTIFKMREILDRLNITSFEANVGFRWEKLDFTPF
jgi:DNA-binding Lrp family transcriptional regulator